MAGMIIDRLSAAIATHALKEAGQDVAQIRGAILETLKAIDVEVVAGGEAVAFVTDPKARGDHLAVRLQLPAGRPLRTPHFAARVRRDHDGDIVLETVEMMLGEKARVLRTAPDAPFRLVVEGELPEGAAEAIVGRRLHDVVDHPAVIQVDAVIAGAGAMTNDERAALILPVADGPIISIELKPFGKTIVR